MQAKGCLFSNKPVSLKRLGRWNSLYSVTAMGHVQGTTYFFFPGSEGPLLLGPDPRPAHHPVPKDMKTSDCHLLQVCNLKKGKRGRKKRKEKAALARFDKFWPCPWSTLPKRPMERSVSLQSITFLSRKFLLPGT